MSPILPENRDLYPDDWPNIRERIRKRAGDRCEWCGVENHAVGWRDDSGRFRPGEHCDDEGRLLKSIKIVCTTAHLNHDPTDCRDENLAFLCQQCHNRYDAPVRAARRREKLLDRMGQTRLFETRGDTRCPTGRD